MMTSIITDVMYQTKSLPEEIIINEILIRLPVKSLCRFKCVSKHWNVAISSRRFIKAHLIEQHDSKSKWVFFQSDQNSYVLDFEAYDHFDAALNLGGVFPLGNVLSAHYKGEDVESVGSSCGLICLLGRSGGPLSLFNPSLRQCLTINYPSPDPFSTHSCVLYGFGYVSSVDDFKIVLCFTGDLESRHNLLTYVFSWRNKSWRKIEGDEHFHIRARAHGVDPKGILVHERLHWWFWPQGYDKDGCIYSFDLLDEVFEEVPVLGQLSSDPPDIIPGEDYSGICNMGGCLCLSIFMDVDKMEIWMLKQYGEWDSWVKLHHFHMRIAENFRFAVLFGFTNTGKFLTFRSYETRDVIYLVDPHNELRPERDPMWQGPVILAIESHIDSLVSPFGTPETAYIRGEID